MIHYFNPGEKILSLRILITPIHALTRGKKIDPPPRLKAVYLAPRQRSHQGQPLKSLGPPSSSLYFFAFFSLPLLFFYAQASRAILKKTLRPPLSPSLETKQIEFRSFDWLKRADLATSASSSRQPESCDFRGEPRRSLSLH